MSANMTATSRPRRPGGVAHVFGSVEFMDSPIAQSSAAQHYRMLRHRRATRIWVGRRLEGYGEGFRSGGPVHIKGTKNVEPGTQGGKEPNTAPEISLRPAQPGDYDFAAALYFDSTKMLLTALG